MIATPLHLLSAALAGAVVGAAYLGLLWLAVRSLPRADGGVTVFLSLALARAVLILGALAAALSLGVQAPGLLAALAGFLAVRLVATRLPGRRARKDASWK